MGTEFSRLYPIDNQSALILDNWIEHDLTDQLQNQVEG